MAESTYIDRCEFDRTMQERYCFNCERIKETHYPIFGVACKTCWVMDMLDEVEAFPAADVRPVVRGRWEPSTEIMEAVDCSVCGFRTVYGAMPDGSGRDYNFCPNCNADMREVDADG